MKKDISRFATEDRPLHCSGLGTLLKCPWRAAMQFLYEDQDVGSEAGDTGSATHVAVAELHRGKEVADCIAAMKDRLGKYPKADLQEAAALFLSYAADTRNRGAEVVLIEKEVAFQISPAEEDKTQAPIQVVGTLDQVRKVNGIYKLFDLKTSKKDGVDLLNQHVFQIAAYCIGASIFLNTKVQPGALICPRKYKTKDPSTAPVFYHFTWTFDDIEQILYGVRHAVAKIRAGEYWHVPGDYCTWCPAKTPDFCLPKLKQCLCEK